MTGTIRVCQLSDTHFLEPGAEPEGGHAYDTSAAFESVLEHLGDHDHLDMVVVTGDVADHGRPQQYDLAVDAFGRFSVPVNVCPGNHDFDRPFRAAMTDGQVQAPRLIEAGPWAFLFVDSSSGDMVLDGHKNLVDPPGETRLHSNGRLGPQEIDWIRNTCISVDADHVFIWLHHPPGVDVPMMVNRIYTEQWEELLADLPRVRGLGAGHTHIPDRYDLAGRSIVVAPSFKNNFDLVANTWLPPGYRTYEFAPDGSVTSEVHLLDDERWPRRPLGRALRSLFMGEISYEQLAEIVARRAATND